jgi:hypothetical protein
MQEDHDGFLIASYPDNAAASTGGTARWQSHELFDGAAQEKIQRVAKSARDHYAPPMA